MTQGLPELVEEFCQRSDIAPKTRAFYWGPLTRELLPYCERHGATAPEQLTPDFIDGLARELDGRMTRQGTPLAVASRAAYMRAMQQFLSWLKTRKKIEGVDSTQVQVPSHRRRHVDILSREDVQRLEDAARTERDKLIVRVMADTGARRGEVASIRVDDVIGRERMFLLRVRGKTGERRVPITPALYKRLVAYASGKTGRPLNTRSPYLFMAERRQPGHREHTPLTEEGVYQAVKDTVARAKLGRRVHPHLFRHSAITYLLVERRMDPMMVADVVGTGLGVIQKVYRHPTDQMRYEAMMRALGELPG